jgi:hypothetical protein
MAGNQTATCRLYASCMHTLYTYLWSMPCELPTTHARPVWSQAMERTLRTVIWCLSVPIYHG